MRSVIASFALGLGTLSASAALPTQAQAADHWQGRQSYDGYNRYYGPDYGYMPPVYIPAPVVRPSYAPYASFSIGWGPSYYRGGNYGNYRGGYHSNYRGGYHSNFRGNNFHHH